MVLRRWWSLKNSARGSVLKGRGSKPRRKSARNDDFRCRDSICLAAHYPILWIGISLPSARGIIVVTFPSPFISKV